MQGWRTALITLVTVVVVVGGSIGLVQFRNQTRGATQAVLWAARELVELPDTLVLQVYTTPTYRTAAKQFEAALRTNEIPVDSIRSFYATYCMWARDGQISADELQAFGSFLDITPELRAMPSDSTLQDSTDVPEETP